MQRDGALGELASWLSGLSRLRSTPPPHDGPAPFSLGSPCGESGPRGVPHCAPRRPGADPAGRGGAGREEPGTRRPARVSGRRNPSAARSAPGTRGPTRVAMATWLDLRLLAVGVPGATRAGGRGGDAEVPSFTASRVTLRGFFAFLGRTRDSQVLPDTAGSCGDPGPGLTVQGPPLPGRGAPHTELALAPRVGALQRRPGGA